MTQDQRQTTPPSWAGLFGDDKADFNVFGNLGPSHHPADDSTATRHARHRQRRDLEAATRRNLAMVDRAANFAAQEQALDRAIELRNAGKEVPAALAAKALPAARRRGLIPSTAEQLAGMRKR